MTINPFNRNRTPTPTPEPDAHAEDRRTVDEILDQRRSAVSDLVGQAEALLLCSRDLIASDADVGRSYAAHTIRPWRDAIEAAFGAFRDEIMANRAELAEAKRLIIGGDVAICIRKFGPLLANILRLETRLAQLKRERPVGLSRVGLHEVVRTRPHPTGSAERMLEICFEGAPADDFGLLTVQDVLSGLRFDEGSGFMFSDRRGISAGDWTINHGSYVVAVWNDERVVAALPPVVPVPA